MLRSIVSGVLLIGLMVAIWLLASSSGCTNDPLLGSICSTETRESFEQAKKIMGTWVFCILFFMTGDFFNLWSKKDHKTE